MNPDIESGNPDRGPNPLASKKEEHEKNTEKVVRRKKQDSSSGLIIGLSVVFGLIFLILLISFGWKLILPDPPTRQVDYGPYHFEIDKDGSWRFDWQRGEKLYSIPLRFNPYQVENVTLQGSLNETFNRPIVYIAFDPTHGNFTTQSLATGELSLNMITALQVKPVAACTINDTDVCFERPIVSCGDPDKSIILIKDEGEAKIWLKDECVVLFGKDFELLRAVDRLLYQWYNIME